MLTPLEVNAVDGAERRASGDVPALAGPARPSVLALRSAISVGHQGHATHLIRVRGASAGAGATTIALAIADALRMGGHRCRLVDAAPPDSSGLQNVADIEFGVERGWRIGACGDLRIERLETPAEIPTDVPDLLEHPAAAYAVLDVGWTHRELQAHPTAWVGAAPATAEVIVGRATPRGLWQLERTLDCIHGPWHKPGAGEKGAGDTGQSPVAEVVITGSRSRRATLEGAGRLLRAAIDQDLVCVVREPRRRHGDLDAGELPPLLRALGADLAARITDRDATAGRGTGASPHATANHNTPGAGR